MKKGYKRREADSKLFNLTGDVQDSSLDFGPDVKDGRLFYGDDDGRAE